MSSGEQKFILHAVSLVFEEILLEYAERVADYSHQAQMSSFNLVERKYWIQLRQAPVRIPKERTRNNQVFKFHTKIAPLKLRDRERIEAVVSLLIPFKTQIFQL